MGRPVPSSLASVATKLTELKHHKRAFIYFLISGEEVVYVGQTIRPVSVRVGIHKSEGRKEFDRVLFYEVGCRDRWDEEIRWIRKLRPKYNECGIPRIEIQGPPPILFRGWTFRRDNVERFLDSSGTAIDEGKVNALMAGYSHTHGVPCSADKICHVCANTIVYASVGVTP